MRLTLPRLTRSGATPAGVEARPGIPPLIRRNTLYFTGAQALQGVAMNLAIPLSPLMVLRLLGSASLAGIGISVLGISRVLVAYPIGKFTDTYGRRPGMVLCILLGHAGVVILAVSVVLSSFPVFLLGIVVLGLGAGAAMQLRVAATDMYPPARRAEGLGYVLTGFVVASLAAPVIVGSGQALSTRVGGDAIALAWTLALVAMAPALLLVLLIRPDPRTIARQLERYWPGYEPSAAPVGDGTDRAAHSQGFLSFLQHPPKLAAYACAATSFGVMSMMMAMTAVVMAHNGDGPMAITIAISIHAIGMFVFSVPLGRLADRLGRVRLLAAGLALEGLGALLVPVTPSYWIITVGIFLVGVGWSAINVASTALLADTTTSEERGRVIGASDTFAGAFSFAMPLIGGLAIESLGPLSVGLIGAALMAAPFLFLARVREVSPGRYSEKEPTPATVR